MYELLIPAMTCKHCEHSITRLLQQVDATIALEFALAQHKVTVKSAQPLSVLSAALAAAGYQVSSGAYDQGSVT
jgi:copper chaperone CopZ